MDSFKSLIAAFFFLIMGHSCSKKQENPNGLWRVQLLIEKGDTVTIPFFMDIGPKNNHLKAVIYNGNEQLVHDSVSYRNDSLVIKSNYFNSELVLLQKRNIMRGYWYDKSRANGYKLPVKAMYNLNHRFSFDSLISKKIDGVWQTVFSPNTEHSYPAIGLFKTDDNSMKGSFATETGDYRFLEGGFDGKTLKLSTFDGAHAFLFNAKLDGDTLRGNFWSGKHWKEPFIAWRNKDAQLTDPFEITKTTSASTKDLQATNLEGKKVSLSDKEFKSKGIILQIMGTWCPNCMDESKFLSQKYKELESKNIEIVALAFEKAEFPQVLKKLKRYKKALNIPYKIWYGGSNRKEEALQKVSFLNKISSYPTLVFILPNGKISRIYTGYYGPGTGSMHIEQEKSINKAFDTFALEIASQ